MKLKIVRDFAAAHFLKNPSLDVGSNKSVYGKCTEMHGHTWRVEIEVEGQVDVLTGMVVNFKELKALVDELDHGVINEKVSLPTAENLVVYFIEKLKEKGLFSRIRVRVYEGGDSYAEDEWVSK